MPIAARAQGRRTTRIEPADQAASGAYLVFAVACTIVIRPIAGPGPRTISVIGDVLELIDCDGVPFGHYAYDPYGNPLAVESRATQALSLDEARAIVEQQPLRFAGYIWDEFTKLYYVGARCYDPAQMTFITRDPEDADGEQSPYMYCADNPVGLVDPEGLWSNDLHVRLGWDQVGGPTH